jgi:flagellar basal-body rod protein FlgB
MAVVDRMFGIHAQALMLRAQRAEMLAANIANADTPNYKARDLEFSAVFSGSLQGLQRTSAGHLRSRGYTESGARIVFRSPDQASLDQNTVDAQVEHAAFIDNAIRYEASLRFLQGRIAGLMLAIRGE